MHITRVVTDRLIPDRFSSNRLQYNLNGVYVYVGYTGRFISVGEGRDRIFQNEALIELATKIGMDSHGNITVDTNDTDIMDFLKHTKCLP